MFETKIEDMSLNQLVDHITKVYHEPLRSNLLILDNLIETFNNKNLSKHPELDNLNVLYNQFKTQILKHITREDFITFPSILKFEKIHTNNLINLSDDFDLMDKLVNDVQMKNQHTEFNLYLNSIIDFMTGSEDLYNGNSEFNEINSLFLSIREDNVEHAKIENGELYRKGVELQNKLISKLNKITSHI